MKFCIYLLVFLLLTSCTSTQKVAEYRNAEFSKSNYYETFKFWRELDIMRFEEDMLNIKIGIVPENLSISDLKNQSYLQITYDSIQVLIKEKDVAFREFKKEYLDTTDQGRTSLFNYLKSDSSNLLFLTDLRNDPYHFLYEDLRKRTISVLKKTSFYSSQKNFEDYILNRSFSICEERELIKIFKNSTIKSDSISKHHWDLLGEQGINFIILFKINYSTDYSEEARERIGSEKIVMKLLDVYSGEIITSAEITHFWGHDMEGAGKSNDAS